MVMVHSRRTREIGIMKAIGGMPTADIRRIFLVESVRHRPARRAGRG